MPSRVPGRLEVAELVDRARSLARQPGRTMLGIVGAPGAGKSTVVDALIRGLGADAALVPMDGFHLADRVLSALGRRERKGAPDTFDAAGYVTLLRRLRNGAEDVVYAPEFRRDLEEPIASSIAVSLETPIVITEGNYLLLPYEPWVHVRTLLDEVWFLMPEEAVRQERLVARHIAFGKDPDAARAWAMGSDQRNAELVTSTADRADLVFSVGQLP